MWNTGSYNFKTVRQFVVLTLPGHNSLGAILQAVKMVHKCTFVKLWLVPIVKKYFSHTHMVKAQNDIRDWKATKYVVLNIFWNLLQLELINDMQSQ